jgi:hypothetical protein
MTIETLERRRAVKDGTEPDIASIQAPLEASTGRAAEGSWRVGAEGRKVDERS